MTAQTFRGESVHKVDAKGRVSIPALFRRVLEASDPDWTEGLNPNLTLVYGGKKQNYLEAYSVEAIADVDARIAKLPRGSKPRRALEFLFNGQAQPMQVDETGRLVLSAKLREKAGITGEACFLGTGDTFQILSPEAFADKAADIEGWMDDLGEDEDIDPLMLLEMNDTTRVQAE